MTTVSVRLPDALAARLEGVAREAERSKFFIIQKAIEAYLEDYVDLRIALERLRDPADAAIGGKELRASLGL